MNSTHKVIKVKSDTYAFLSHMKELLNASSYDEVIRRTGVVVFEFCKEEYSKDAWRKINEEENRVPFNQFAATE